MRWLLVSEGTGNSSLSPLLKKIPQGIWGDLLCLMPLLLLHWIVGFQKWNNFYWDTARELLTPRRVLAGDIPFRDFEVLYGPLPYHVTAFFLKIFGTHIWVDRAISATLLTLTILMLCHIARDLGFSRAWRLMLGLTFIALFAFPIDGFSLFAFMMPHCQQGTYQPLFQLLMAFCVIKIFKTKRVFWTSLLALLGGGAGLFVRLDGAIGLCFFSAIGVLAPWFFKASVGDKIKRSILNMVLAALPGAFWVLLTTQFISLNTLIERVSEIRYFLNSSSDPFVWKAFVRSGVFGLLMVLSVYYFTRNSKRAVGLWGVFAFILAIWFLTASKHMLSTQYFFIVASFGFLSIAGFAYLSWKEPREQTHWIYLILSAGGCLFIIRSFVSAYSFTSFVYGGVLLLLVFFFTLHYLSNRWLKDRRAAVMLGSSWIVGLALLTFASVSNYRNHSVPMDTIWGRVWLRPAVEIESWRELAKVVQEKVPVDARVYSYSPNNPIYFIVSRLPSEYDTDGTRWKSQIEDGVLKSFAEKRMISQIERYHVEWIIQDNVGYTVHAIQFTKNLFEKGLIKHDELFMGRDEAPELKQWIDDHFKVYQHWGGPLEPEQKVYGISLLRKQQP